MSIEGHLIRDRALEKLSALTLTQNTGKGQNRKKSILIAEGGSFIAYVIRDHKSINSGNTDIIL